MSLALTDQERGQLDRTASDLIDAHPRVIDLIARGAAVNPKGLALVYLRTPADDDQKVK